MMNKKKNEDLFRTVSLSPFKYLSPSVRTQSYFIVFALIPQILMLFVTASFSSIFVLMAALMASLVAEFVDFERNRKDAFIWTVAFIRGTLIGLLLPSTFPPLSVFLISFAVLLLNRKILGGFANSWLNPIALTIVICWLVGMKYFPPMFVTVEELQTRNPSLFLIQNGSFPVLDIDARITNFLNNKVFEVLGVSIPDGYVSLFWDTKSVIPAFRFNFVTILSSIVLFAFNVYGSMIPTVFMLVYAILVRFVAPIFYDGPAMHGDVLLAFLSSGTLFYTLFLLQWHGTIPLMNRGKLIYGFFAGIGAFLIVGVGTSPSGFAFTILILNVVSPLIQTVENYFERKYTKSVVAKKVQIISDGLNA